MKKIIAALILFIYLFNLGGQWALHQYFEYMSGKFFNEQTSKGFYNTGDLTEIKIPVNMPNIADWPTYENVRGRIVFENTSYNYVKMRITRTALYLMCVPDYKTTRLSNQNVIDARQDKSAPLPKKDHVPHSKTTVSGQFNCVFTQFAFCSFAKSLPGAFIQLSARLASRYPDIPTQPPKSFC